MCIPAANSTAAVPPPIWTMRVNPSVSSRPAAPPVVWLSSTLLPCRRDGPSRAPAAIDHRRRMGSTVDRAPREIPAARRPNEGTRLPPQSLRCERTYPMASSIAANTFGSGPGLLLIHGLGGSWRSWNPLLPALSSHREVIAIDLPGHGDFPRSPRQRHLCRPGRQHRAVHRRQRSRLDRP
ncbi:MAG: alpha/beta fold hydrolase, partial [Tsuneonella sp.]